MNFKAKVFLRCFQMKTFLANGFWKLNMTFKAKVFLRCFQMKTFLANGFCGPRSLKLEFASI